MPGPDVGPPSMLFVGAGNTGVQVASIFNAFGSRAQLFEAPTEDAQVGLTEKKAAKHTTS